jgi:hypothetical protein
MTKESYIEEHSFICKGHSRIYCDNNPVRFVFYANKKFHLVSYNKCMEFGEEYKFKKEIVQSVLVKSKDKQSYTVNSGVDVARDMKRFRINQAPFRKSVEVVHYLYHNNARKEYAITTVMPYFEAMIDDSIDVSGKKCIEYLTECEYNYLIVDVNNLIYMNKHWNTNMSKVEVYKTAELLIKQLNHETNQ